MYSRCVLLNASCSNIDAPATASRLEPVPVSVHYVLPQKSSPVLTLRCLHLLSAGPLGVRQHFHIVLLKNVGLFTVLAPPASPSRQFVQPLTRLKRPIETPLDEIWTCQSVTPKHTPAEGHCNPSNVSQLLYFCMCQVISVFITTVTVCLQDILYCCLSVRRLLVHICVCGSGGSKITPSSSFV